MGCRGKGVLHSIPSILFALDNPGFSRPVHYHLHYCHEEATFIIYDFPEALGLLWFYGLGLPFVAWNQPSMINHFVPNIKTYSAQ